jgi:4-hydroxybenzoate polyprenyltransferase
MARPLASEPLDRADESLLRDARALMLDTYQFTRFAAVGFSLLLPLLGAASATRSAAHLDTLIAAAAAFHLYAYVLNDVVDLRFDRLEPLRADDPLVAGRIGPGSALFVAMLQLPVAVVVTALAHPPALAFGALAVAFITITLYDLFGKRTNAPIVTDAVQGVAWAALVLFGALVSGGVAAPSTVTIAGGTFVYILMINGVHGAVRDLPSDLRGGACTTAILLGARPAGPADTALYLSRGLTVYAAILQLLLLLITGGALWAGWSAYPPSARTWVASVYGLVAMASLVLLTLAPRRASDRWGLITVGMFHLIVSLALLIVPVAPLMTSSLAWTALVAYVVPVAAMLGRNGFRWQ